MILITMVGGQPASLGLRIKKMLARIEKLEREKAIHAGQLRARMETGLKELEELRKSNLENNSILIRELEEFRTRVQAAWVSTTRWWCFASFGSGGMLAYANFRQEDKKDGKKD